MKTSVMKSQTAYDSQKTSKALIAAAFFAFAAVATVLFTLISTIFASDAQAMPMVERQSDEMPMPLRTEVYTMHCVEAATVTGARPFKVSFVVELNAADVPKTGNIASLELGQCRDGQAEITQGALGGAYDIFELRAGGDSLCKSKGSVEASLYFSRSNRSVQTAVLKVGQDRYNCSLQ